MCRYYFICKLTGSVHEQTNTKHLIKGRFTLGAGPYNGRPHPSPPMPMGFGCAWVGMAAILLFMGGHSCDISGHGCNLKGKCRALTRSQGREILGPT